MGHGPWAMMDDVGWGAMAMGRRATVLLFELPSSEIPVPYQEVGIALK